MNLPCTLSGKVVHGRSLGNTYDCPTANILPSEVENGLAYGVYYSVITIDGKEYPAITNLGVRPTVSDEGRVNAETFIFDHDEDLYGKFVSVTLLEFRRYEERFDSLDELIKVVHDDFREARKYHGLAPDQ